MRTRKITSMLVSFLLVLSLAIQAGAATPPVATAKPPIADMAGLGVPLSDDEMDEVRGQWGWIVLGAATGALYSAIVYSLSNAADDFSWKELGKEALKGAGWGAVGATVSTVAVLAKGGSLAVKASDAAWTIWGSTNSAVMHGAAGAVSNELKKR